MATKCKKCIELALSQSTLIFYLAAMEKNWEKLHVGVGSLLRQRRRKWWTRFILTESTIFSL